MAGVAQAGDRPTTQHVSTRPLHVTATSPIYKKGWMNPRLSTLRVFRITSICTLSRNNCLRFDCLVLFPYHITTFTMTDTTPSKQVSFPSLLTLACSRLVAAFVEHVLTLAIAGCHCH